jgi:autoinducer 2 (AI-2) kinase
MKAEVLDGILTGRLSGVNAAMTGRLSFSGDTRLAMTLQRIARDLGRLYGLAREETGGQVDLPVDPRPSPAPTRSVAPVAAGDVRQEILRVVNDLYAAGFVSATAGNVSARSTGTGEVWITPSGQLKEDVRIESLVRLSLDGGVLDAEACTPSSERFMHCAIYRARPDVSAVIHAHAPQSNLLGLAGLPFLPISVEAACVKDLPRVPFLMPGSQELARAVCSALGRGQAVLLVNHGLVVASDNLRSALNLVHVIERTAQDIVTCYAVGRQPQALPEEVVSQLGDLGPAIT